ncbi:MAG: FAD-dependent oxidoreductase [Dehalococcoidia bacterium]|nr:FAD-dependent oxidoreductase [Dehalococcoidia bacterium]
MGQSIETIIIGGGQAGLSTSYHLAQRGCEHIVLEQAAQAGNAWRNGRWDSFTLLTPNWSFRLPGAEYHGNAPDGFMARDDIVACFEQYVERFHLPVRYGVRVTSVVRKADGKGYLVRTEETAWEAQHVVMATGLFQQPKIPSCRTDLSARITQLDSGKYRNPQALPPGAVLVVGSAQSGCQIAEELYQNGRRVYLCVGGAGRVPRRYRGKDVYEWLHLSGFLDRTADKLPSPKAKFTGNPHVSGRDGGRALNLHQFARDGVVLLGRLQGARDNTIWLADDLKDSLAKADKFEAEVVKLTDNFIAQNGLNAPPENLPQLRDGYDADAITKLDLHSVGITTIIWAMGYVFDFSLVKLPIFDSDGYPVQKRGVTDYPGLFFIGLPWLYKQKSGLLIGVGEDADFIASAIAARKR